MRLSKSGGQMFGKAVNVLHSVERERSDHCHADGPTMERNARPPDQRTTDGQSPMGIRCRRTSQPQTGTARVSQLARPDIQAAREMGVPLRRRRLSPRIYVGSARGFPPRLSERQPTISTYDKTTSFSVEQFLFHCTVCTTLQ